MIKSDVSKSLKKYVDLMSCRTKLLASFSFNHFNLRQKYGCIIHIHKNSQIRVVHEMKILINRIDKYITHDKVLHMKYFEMISSNNSFDCYPSTN